MNSFRATLLFVCAGVAALQPASAEAASQSRVQISQTFRIHVNGDADASSAFWVAYGPVKGRFSIVQLHSSDGHSFRATRQLPLRARTTFTYLMSAGRIHTRAGWAPAERAMTITQLGPVVITPAQPAVVQWQVPVG